MQKENISLVSLLEQKLNTLYDIELMLVDALPKMAEASTDKDLKAGFEGHLLETEKQVKRLEKIHQMLGIKPKKLKSEAIRGLLEDTKWVMKNIPKGQAMDTVLARSAQTVEHYEIACYEGAISWACELDLDDIVIMLEETLSEEMMADEKLNTVGTILQKKTLVFRF